MAINFPSSPTLNQITTVGTVQYQWNGTSWNTYVNVGSSDSVYRSNLIFEFDFKGDTSTTLTDRSGNNYNGTVVNTVNWNPLGRGFIFNGSNYIDLSRSGESWNGATGHTYEFVYLPYTNPNYPRFFDAWVTANGGTTLTFVQSLANSGRPAQSLDNDEITYTHSTGRWHYWIFRQRSGFAEAFLNGSLVFKKSIGSLSPTTARPNAYLGLSSYSADDKLNGIMALARSYRVPLTDAQLLANVKTTRAALLNDGILV